MDQQTPKSGEQNDDVRELTVLLRTLWVETTREAHFEDRFINDFRRRVERELVCRSARSVLWEHLVMFMNSLGVKRLALGASAFSLGALCVGVLVWQQGGPTRQTEVTPLCELESRAKSLRPGSSQQVVRTAVHTGKFRRAANHSIVVLADGEEDPLYVGNTAEEDALYAPQRSSLIEPEDSWIDSLR